MKIDLPPSLLVHTRFLTLVARQFGNSTVADVSVIVLKLSGCSSRSASRRSNGAFGGEGKGGAKNADAR